MERNLRRAMALSGGEWRVLFDSEIAITLWGLAALASLVVPTLLARLSKASAAQVASSEG